MSLKLTGLGYQVWSDVTRLLGGEDFWRDIEPIIRDSTAKFLYVISRSSNHKEGALRELRVADAVGKKEGLKDFIIPLRIDDLPHSEINIEVGRLNVIEFGDWATGLKQLCEKLAADAIPRSDAVGPNTVRLWWEREFAADNGVTNEPEVHYSNWFPIQLPLQIYRYATMGLIDGEPQWSFSTRWHELRLITFAPAGDVELGLRTLRIQQTEELRTDHCLSGENVRRQDHRNIVTGLLGDAWERFALSRGLKRYQMAGGRSAFYFDLDSLPNPNVSFLSVGGEKTRRGLMGYKTRKKSGTLRHWHFAVSAKPVLHPQPMLQLRAHVLFSDDGRTIWSSPDALHKARRSQCKDWWNDDWRDRLLATTAWLAGGEPAFRLPLSSASTTVAVDVRPLEFLSPVTLLEPSAHPDADSTLGGDLDEDEDVDDFETAGVEQ